MPRTRAALRSPPTEPRRQPARACKMASTPSPSSHRSTRARSSPISSDSSPSQQNAHPGPSASGDEFSDLSSISDRSASPSPPPATSLPQSEGAAEPEDSDAATPRAHSRRSTDSDATVTAAPPSMLLVLESSHAPLHEDECALDAYERCFALSGGTSGHLVEVGREQRRTLEHAEALGLRDPIGQASPSPHYPDSPVHSQPLPQHDYVPFPAPSSPCAGNVSEACAPWDPSSDGCTYSPSPNSAIQSSGPVVSSHYWHSQPADFSSSSSQHHVGPTSHQYRPYTLEGPGAPLSFSAPFVSDAHSFQRSWPSPSVHAPSYFQAPQQMPHADLGTLAMPFAFDSTSPHPLDHPSGLPTAYDYPPPFFPPAPSSSLMYALAEPPYPVDDYRMGDGTIQSAWQEHYPSIQTSYVKSQKRKRLPYPQGVFDDQDLNVIHAVGGDALLVPTVYPGGLVSAWCIPDVPAQPKRMKYDPAVYGHSAYPVAIQNQSGHGFHPSASQHYPYFEEDSVPSGDLQPEAALYDPPALSKRRPIALPPVASSTPAFLSTQGEVVSETPPATPMGARRDHRDGPFMSQDQLQRLKSGQRPGTLFSVGRSMEGGERLTIAQPSPMLPTCGLRALSMSFTAGAFGV